jgi:hypothetical protein
MHFVYSGKAVSMGTIRLRRVNKESTRAHVSLEDVSKRRSRPEGPQFPSLGMYSPFAHDGARLEGFQPVLKAKSKETTTTHLVLWLTAATFFLNAMS